MVTMTTVAVSGWRGWGSWSLWKETVWNGYACFNYSWWWLSGNEGKLGWFSFLCHAYLSMERWGIFTINKYSLDSPVCVPIYIKKKRFSLTGSLISSIFYIPLHPTSFCLSVVDESEPCVTNPCLHGGKCLPQGTGYSCYCPQGYTGENCEIGEWCLQYTHIPHISTHAYIHTLAWLSQPCFSTYWRKALQRPIGRSEANIHVIFREDVTF